MSLWLAVGIGGSGDGAAARVTTAMTSLTTLGTVRGRSPRYANPAWGGATRAPFVNACVVVDSVHDPAAAMMELLRLERGQGRVRAMKNGARTLDLDLLWWSAPVATSSSAIGSSSLLTPSLPHPRLAGRAFAVIPLVDALVDAGVCVPVALAAAAGRLRLSAPLTPLPSA
jgi:2-amino-4-hydroxy-6-hydroxymethyldihydropteridine diphosphokinase